MNIGNAQSSTRGNVIEYINGVWCYEDGTPALHERPCTKCGRIADKDGPDPCLGYLPGVEFACCGHGDPRRAYIKFKNGLVIREFTKVER